MLLTTWKFGSQWEITAKVFSLRGPSFEMNFTNFIDLISPPLYEALVKRETFYPLDDTVRDCQKFENFPTA